MLTRMLIFFAETGGCYRDQSQSTCPGHKAVRRALQRADLEAIGQAHISAVAGACLSIGIKFAGSGNAAAEQVLRHYVLYFLKAKQQAPDSSTGQCSL